METNIDKLKKSLASPQGEVKKVIKKKDNIFVTFINSIKAYFFNTFIKPFKDKAETKRAAQRKIDAEKERERSVAELKKNFEKQFQTNIESTKKVMQSQKHKQTDNEYLTNEIIKARKYLSENGINMGGQITDPTALNSHNDNGGYTTNTISEVMKKDKEFADKMLNGRDTRELKQKAKVRWITRQ